MRELRIMVKIVQISVVLLFFFPLVRISQFSFDLRNLKNKLFHILNNFLNDLLNDSLLNDLLNDSLNDSLI